MHASSTSMPVNVRFLLCLVQKQKPGVTSTKLFVDQKYLNSQKWCRPRWPMSCLSFVEHTGRSMESHTQVYGLHTGLWTKHRSMDSHTQVYGLHTGLWITHRSMDYTQVYGLHGQVYGLHTGLWTATHSSWYVMKTLWFTWRARHTSYFLYWQP